MNTKRFKAGDKVYCVDDKQTYCHIFAAVITGECQDGPGYEATTDVGFRIHTCSMEGVVRTMKEARRLAEQIHRKQIAQIKARMSQLSRDLTYLLWAVANPNLVCGLPHDFAMDEEQKARWRKSAEEYEQEIV